jgi:hypothetical protein
MIQFSDLTSKSFLKTLTEKEALSILGGFFDTLGSGIRPAPSERPDTSSEIQADLSIKNARVFALSYKQNYFSDLQQLADLGKDIQTSLAYEV